jgi:NADH-quinone oxidoreductase subunit G
VYNYTNEPNGSMKGGDPGVTLIEPTVGYKNAYFAISPQPFELLIDEWLIIPVFQIFGSEELSASGSSISQRIQEPFIYLNQKDAEIFDAVDNDLIQLEVPNSKLLLKIKIENTLKPGIAGLSVNLPGMPFIGLPCRGKFHKI